jgi:hypothetical protein
MLSLKPNCKPCGSLDSGGRREENREARLTARIACEVECRTRGAGCASSRDEIRASGIRSKMGGGEARVCSRQCWIIRRRLCIPMDEDATAFICCTRIKSQGFLFRLQNDANT